VVGVSVDDGNSDGNGLTEGTSDGARDGVAIVMVAKRKVSVPATGNRVTRCDVRSRLYS